MTPAAEARLKCPYCGFLNQPDAKTCGARSPICRKYLKSDLECFRSIDVSLTTIKRIAIWWMILPIVAAIGCTLYVLSQVRY